MLLTLFGSLTLLTLFFLTLPLAGLRRAVLRTLLVAVCSATILHLLACGVLFFWPEALPDSAVGLASRGATSRRP
jgi:hypothetical protein